MGAIVFWKHSPQQGDRVEIDRVEGNDRRDVNDDVAAGFASALGIAMFSRFSLNLSCQRNSPLSSPEGAFRNERSETISNTEP